MLYTDYIKFIFDIFSNRVYLGYKDENFYFYEFYRIKQILKNKIDDKYIINFMNLERNRIDDFIGLYNRLKDKRFSYFFKYMKDIENIDIFLNFFNNSDFEDRDIFVRFKEYFLLVKFYKIDKKIDSNDSLILLINKNKNRIGGVNFDNLKEILFENKIDLKKIKDGEYFGDIDLSFVGIEKNLMFFKVLGIEKINGNLYVDNNSKLTSLKGIPSYITGDCNCSDCSIVNFGIDEEVRIDGDFICKNNLLKSLENGPKFVGGEINCSKNEKLKSLKNFFEYFKGIDCSDCGLIKIEKEDIKVKNIDFLICSNNKKLEYIELENIKIFDLSLNNCNLKEMKLDRIEVKNFDCSGNENLTNLDNCPKIIKGDFNCSFCNIRDLSGLDDVIIYGSFDCSNNKIYSLNKGPSYIGYDFKVNNNKLVMVDLKPNLEIGNNLYILNGNRINKRKLLKYIEENNIKVNGKIY